jgi:hypothetical protein
MVVAIITGLKGDGKTTLSTMFAYNAFTDGRPVYSNYGLKFKYTELYVNRVKDELEKLQNAMLVVDEAYLYVDSRNFSSKGNKAVGYLVLQTRKKGVDLILNLLQKSLGDLRIRENSDYIYDCEAMRVINGLLVRATIEDIENQLVDVIRVYKADVRMRVLSTFVFDPAPYFKMFDTREMIDITA